VRTSAKPKSKSELKALAARFESLGQSSIFSDFQRACEVTTSEISRVSEISLPPFLDGIEAAFSEIGNVAELDLRRQSDGQGYLVLHRRYGLLYPSAMRSDESLEALKKLEAESLSGATRDLLEQIRTGSKIFVIQRETPTLQLREVIPLLHVLRRSNASNALLWISESGPEQKELSGRVEWLAPLFFRGYVDQWTYDKNNERLVSDAWIEVCSTVVAVVELTRSS